VSIAVIPVQAPRLNAKDAAPWFAIGAALVLLYAPGYAALVQGPWQGEALAHAPLVAAVAFALLWRARRELLRLPAARAPRAAAAGLTAGLLLALLGRAQDLHLLTVLSQPLLFGGIVALYRGRPGLAVAAFPLLYLLFTLPLPGALLDAVTAGLKTLVSASVEELLYAIGYPVARDGVVLTIGQYQLLVAEACSGLHSMISLSALGTLYVHLVQPRRLADNTIFYASLLPIAFVANLLRVLALSLLTYHGGDALARALHDALGVALFALALLLLLGLDRLLRAVGRSRST
jgi:exosortase B